MGNVVIWWPIPIILAVAVGFFVIDRRKKKVIGRLLVVSWAFLAVAAGYTSYNLYKEEAAEAYSNQRMEELMEQIQELKAYRTVQDTEPQTEPATETAEEAGGEESIEPVTLPPADEVSTEDPYVTVDGVDYIGTINVPLLGLELPVTRDWSYDSLKKAPGRYYGSANGDDIVIMAHSYKGHFRYIRTLKEGDDVIFIGADGTVNDYKVKRLTVLEPSAVYDMIIANDWDLTLFTCTGDSSSRVTLRCVRAENFVPSAETEEESGSESNNG